MREPELVFERDGHILTIEINRPKNLNAVTLENIEALGTVFAEADADDQVRVVLLTGRGERGFCAGADLGKIDPTQGGGQPPRVRVDGHPLLPIVEFSKPLIGAINGAAIGVGLGLAAACDICVAAETARFGTGFARIGIVAGDMVAWLLPRRVGVSKALELIYRPAPIDAQEAYRIGLVSYVVPQDELRTRAMELARDCAAAPPVATRFSKRLVVEGLGRSPREHVLAQDYAALANLGLARHDLEEAASAYRDKRTPSYSGVVRDAEDS